MCAIYDKLILVQLAALDFIGCTAADAFAMTDSGSQLSSLVSGYRIYHGAGKMLTFDQTSKDFQPFKLDKKNTSKQGLKLGAFIDIQDVKSVCALQIDFFDLGGLFLPICNMYSFFFSCQ